MKILSLFNNKGGVGKSTLAYHLGCALSEMGKKVLFLDLDPQCNLTLMGIEKENLHRIWEEEQEFIDDFEKAANANQDDRLEQIRSIHYLLKPVEDGISDSEDLPEPYKINENLFLIPGRLSIHRFENKIAERWSGLYQSDNLAIRTVTKIRRVCEGYGKKLDLDYIIIDTSPSLGILNKVIISTVDGFIIPCQPDMFSMYGIRNIGNSLEIWKREFDSIYSLLSTSNIERFPKKFVQFLGFAIYNAKKYSSGNNEYNLAASHYQYVKKIPNEIKSHIRVENRELLSEEEIQTPLGIKSILHTHNTFPSIAQALRCPIWAIPSTYKEVHSNPYKWEKVKEEMGDDFTVNQGAFGLMSQTKDHYVSFASEVVNRAEKI